MKPKITLLTNISFAQQDNLRLECHALLIEPQVLTPFGGYHRLRGFGTSGSAPVFTQWLTDIAFIIAPAESKNAIVIGDAGNAKPLFYGSSLRIDGKEYFLQIEDNNFPLDEMDVTELDYPDIWNTLSQKVELYWQAPNMPRTSWGPPRRVK